MELSLELKQTQKLNPQMIQTMEILQMGTIELQDYVQNLLLENPVLELEDEHHREEYPTLHHKLEWLAANDRQNRWYHQDDPNDLMELVSAPEENSLYDHLRGQLHMPRFSPQMCLAIDCVLTGLNPCGYLDESTEELAARCGQPPGTVLRAEQIVRGLSPAGIGARFLSECLSLQLERMGERGLPLIIVQTHLEAMAQGRYGQIARATGADRSAVQQACDLIRTLDPKPGAPFAPREAPGYLIPDLLVTEESGQLIITPSDEFLPILRVSKYYFDLMANTDDPEVRSYLTKKVQQADWVVKSIDQRKATLMRCAQAITHRQADFFLRHDGQLKPMTLADVAGEMNVHESTVSRAIKDKYIQCKRGTLPLSAFFRRALPSCADGVTPEHARDAIRALVSGEDPRRPLSDQKLCDLLLLQQLTISRRTVAKYRKEMGIPAASDRKTL